MSTPKFIQLLEDRKSKGSERSLLSFDTNYRDFWSNDYLGLGKDLTSITLKAGSGSRLISGNTDLIESVESNLTSHFESEAALFFNSGYDANLGLFSSVPQKGDTVLYDELVHASIRDGIRLSHAKAYGFKHNDLEDLAKKLKLATGICYVVVESIYSMDGDLAPLLDMLALCKACNALMIVDEAHAGGVYGPKGTGKCVELGIHRDVFARIVTFGKAFGAHGAIVLGSKVLRHYLINFARSFIFTTALPEAFILHVWEQVQRAASNDLNKRLQSNIALFRSRIEIELSHASSPIQVLVYDDTNTCKKIAERLQAEQFAVKAILAPTVPENAPRLRFCLHAFNTPEEIIALTSILAKF